MAAHHSARIAPRLAGNQPEAGFSLVELMIATGILLMISGVVTSAILQMTTAEKTIWNRTEMHSGIRSATELLQQEVGQAGLITLSGPVTLSNAVAIGTQTIAVSSVAGMFQGQRLLIDTGGNQETVVLTAAPNTSPNPPQITVNSIDDDGDLGGATGGAPQVGMAIAHLAGAPVQVVGGFASGIVPDTGVASGVAITNGSDGYHLKMFGDINGDGKMVYVEYFCDVNGTNNLYRNVLAWNAASKPAPTASQILLSNVMPNPPAGSGPACFQYQDNTSFGNTYVLDVAITLTVQTQQVDPVTKQFQTETKALLNVTPRNVFNTWKDAGTSNRVQPIPGNITTNLLP
jgi:type II secretory pathway pseudopilin PulG